MRSVKLSISLQQLSSVIYVSSGCTLTAAVSIERERRGAHGEEVDHRGLPGQEEVNMGRAWESWCLLRYL